MTLKVKIGFTIEPELLREIDELRGITKRSTFIEYIIRLGLKTYKEKENPIPNPTSRLPKARREAHR
ncbi:MAG: ribbon-helix-helix domain-containing protein [Nitrososphaeria archaeon]